MWKKTSHAASLAALLLGLSSAVPAQAQSGFALDRWDPSERGSSWFSGESLDFSGNPALSAGLWAAWGHRPLVAYNADGSVNQVVVENQVVLHPGATLTVVDWLRFGFDLPIAAYQNGAGLNLAGQELAEPSPALGDVRLGVDARFLGIPGDLVRLAGGVQVHIPTGSQANYMSDGAARIHPRLMIAGDAGAFAYSARVGFFGRFHTADFGDGKLGSEVTFAAAVGARVFGDRLLLGPEVFGSTVTSDFFGKRATPFEVLFGGHYHFTKAWQTGLAVGPGLTRGFGSPTLRLIGGLEYAPTAVAKDTDFDGIPDDSDACPRTFGVKTNDAKTHGCPRVRDTDGDGINDSEDSCPTVAGEANRDRKRHGCPPPATPADRDGDGIADVVDACPAEKGVAHKDQKRHGCPPPRDRDGDGVLDEQDVCPEVAGPASTDSTKTGCPDSDGDGILDRDDACPRVKGVPNEDPKKNGCPEAVLEGGKITILDQVRFDTGKSVIKAESNTVLEAVLKVLTDNPQIKRLRIEGHTDDRGSRWNNLNLSRARAKAVMAWLTSHGVEAKRLSSEGYGQARPLVSNDTDEGRLKNRRVEFIVVETAGDEK